jgi:hypothetical protein
VAPPNLPAVRKVALQNAFMATMKDAEFLADANKLGLEVTPAKMVDKPLPIEEVLQKP